MNEFHLYVFISLLISLFLTLRSRSNHKFITFVITYWILAGSVLNTEYFIIDIQSLPFDLQPDRIIFILFSTYLIFAFFAGKIKINKEKKPKFEKYLLLYIFLSITVNIIHSEETSIIKHLFVNSTKILTFFIIYLVIKKTANLEMIKVYGKAILIVCTFSSLIGIYQFLVEPLWFRFGAARPAFGEFIRSNGIFPTDHIQSYFLISGLILVLFTIRKKSIKFSLIAIFLLGIILAFHRMSWIINILLFTLYLLKIRKVKLTKMILAGSSALALILLLLTILLPHITALIKSPIVEERLLENTFKSRIRAYTMVIRNIPNNWLIGFGHKKTDAYFYGMIDAGMSEAWAKGEKGGLHNLYLAIIFYQGIPVMIIFTVFIFVTFHYFWRLGKYKNVFYFIISFEILKFIVLNITNACLIGTDLSLLLAIFIGSGVAVYQKNIDTTGIIVNE